MKLQGYAAVWWAVTGSAVLFPTDGSNDLRERFAPGCFRIAEHLRDGEIKLCWRHDQSFVIARSTDETLSLREDDRGLWFAADPRGYERIVDMVRDRRITKMSPRFRPIEWRRDLIDGEQIRTIIEARVSEISLALYPAHRATNVNALPSTRLRKYLELEL